MIHVTCPGCLATVAAQPGSTSRCPTCGTVFTAPGKPISPVASRPSAPPVASRPSAPATSTTPEKPKPRVVDDDPPPTRRSRRRDDDDDDDDRPRARTGQAKKRAQSGDAVLPMIMLGGVFLVLVLIGIFGVVIYYFTSGAISSSIAKATSATTPPPEFDPNNPNFDPFAAMNQQGQNGFPPAPAMPAFPNVPNFPGGNMPGMPGMPNMPAPIMPNMPGMPAMPNMPGMPGVVPPNNGGGAQPNQPGQPGTGSVTLTRATKTRKIGLSQEIEVDYQYAAGQFRGPMDVLIVRCNGEDSMVRIIGIGGSNGTIQFRSTRLSGRIEIWMERRTSLSPFGDPGVKISNTAVIP